MASITKKSDGKYLIRISKGSGKGRAYLNITFRGTLKKAREHAREKETLLDSGYRPEAGLTFEKYFKQWIKAITPKLEPRTLDGYEGSITRYALEPLGRMKLGDIRNFNIQDIYIACGERLSATTVRNLHAALNACFGYAVRHEYLRTNPCKHTDLPKKGRSREIVVMDNDEAAEFIGLCQTMPRGVIFDFALETGMRPEEYLGLRWADIRGNDVMVQQAVQFNRKGGGYYFKDIKTPKGRRRIPISEHLHQRLIVHRREQNEQRLAMQGTWFNHDLVFANEVGRPYSLNNLTNRYLTPLVNECGFDKHIGLYALRHSMATLLLMAGENVKVVSERLGHASVVLTLDIYSHVLPHIQESATKAMDNILRMKI